MRRFTLVFISIIMAVSIQANPIVWTGDGDGVSWADGDNWDTDIIPDASSVVSFTGVSIVVSSGVTAVAESIICTGSLTIDAGGMLTLSGSPTGVYSIEWINTPGNSLTVDGTILMENGGGMITPRTDIIIGTGGEVLCNNIHGFGIFQTPSIPAVFVNDGTITITDNDFTTSIFADIVNNGTINLTRAGRII